MLEQERCSKILESILNDHVDQRHLQGEHDFPRPWDIDKVCVDGPGKCRARRHASTDALGTIPS